MAGNLGIQPDAKKVYVYRLYSLIADGGGLVYRKVFTDYANRESGSVTDHLEKYQYKIKQCLLQNAITRVQYDKLFPSRHPASFADNFDLSLLAFLVRVTCAEEAVDEVLREKVADLEKLKRFRNEIAHIHSTEEYSETKFETFWGRIRSAILQLGEGIPGLEEEIGKLKSNPIDPRREAELQEIILDLQRKAECAQDLTNRLELMEINQRDAVDKVHAKLDDQTILLKQLHQIIKDPYLLLPSPGDFQSETGEFSQLRVAYRGPSSIHMEQRHQYKQKDDRSGFKYVETHHKMLTKGTVTALEEKDYEDLSKVIGDEWPSLASHLGLSESQVKRIETSFERSDIRARISEMLRVWSETEKEHATIERLIKTALDCPVLNIDECAFEDIRMRHINLPSEK